MEQYLMDGPMLLKVSDLVGLVSIVVLLLAILIYQSARRNHYLKSIDRSLKLSPSIKFERRLAEAEKRAVR